MVVNWALPMTEQAHHAIAMRVHYDYIRATKMIANPEKHKQMRKSQVAQSQAQAQADDKHKSDEEESSSTSTSTSQMRKSQMSISMSTSR